VSHKKKLPFWRFFETLPLFLAKPSPHLLPFCTAATASRSVALSSDTTPHHTKINLINKSYSEICVNYLCDKSNCLARPTSSCCPSNSVNVIFAVSRNVKINNYIHMGDVQTSKIVKKLMNLSHKLSL
jgi:hypothetical protein